MSCDAFSLTPVVMPRGGRADMEGRSKSQRGWFSLASSPDALGAHAEHGRGARLTPATRSARSNRMEAIARTPTPEPNGRSQHGGGSRVGDLLLKQGVIGAADLRVALGRLREAGGAVTTYVVK